MKILILDTYYPSFLNYFWDKNYALKKQGYQSQIKNLIDNSFGTADFYSHFLNHSGHEAFDIIANDQITQSSWIKEVYGTLSPQNLVAKLLMSSIIVHAFGGSRWVEYIIQKQVNFFNPDIVYVHDLSLMSNKLLRKIKGVSKLIGQIASPIPSGINLKLYDLILTSFPHYVAKFKKIGVKSKYFKIGFDQRMIKKVGKSQIKYDLSFVGSFTKDHTTGTAMLEKLARTIPIHVWGRGVENLSSDSPLRKNYHGEAWGLEMYNILASSKIVINRHSSAANSYVNNMRMYEVTGMGSLLITDHGRNLPELFNVNKEVLSYRNFSELHRLVKYYLTHDDERIRIARAGQQRTLNSHTYSIRIMELLSILQSVI